MADIFFGGCVQCAACGELPDYELELLFSLRENPSWKTGKDRGRCTTGELRNAEFETPWLWGTFFRAIIPLNQAMEQRNRIVGHPFQLTGVGQTHLSNSGLPLTVPTDQDTVLIGHTDNLPGDIVKRVYPTQLVPFESDDPPDPKFSPRAYYIHERCWNAVEQLIGKTIVEDNLDLFVEAIRQRWGETGKDLSCGESESFYYSWELENIPSDDFLQDPSKYIREHMEYFEKHPDVLLNRDPINIPEVRDMIQDARRRFHMGEYQKESKSFSSFSILPLEIQCCVVDFLSDPQDIQNILVAFDWRLPDAYWRTRLSKDLIFEEELLRSKSLDWQYLFLQIKISSKTSYGLRNRQRLMRILNGTRKVFFELMEKFQRNKKM